MRPEPGAAHASLDSQPLTCAPQTALDMRRGRACSARRACSSRGQQSWSRRGSTQQSAPRASSASSGPGVAVAASCASAGGSAGGSATPAAAMRAANWSSRHLRGRT